MDVSRPVWVAVEQLYDLAGRSIIWNWIRRRAETVERIFAVFIRFELSMKVVFDLIFILLRIKT